MKRSLLIFLSIFIFLSACGFGPAEPPSGTILTAKKETKALYIPGSIEQRGNRFIFTVEEGETVTAMAHSANGETTERAVGFIFYANWTRVQNSAGKIGWVRLAHFNW